MSIIKLKLTLSVIVVTIMFFGTTLASEIPSGDVEPKKHDQTANYKQLANQELATTIFNQPNPAVPRSFKNTEEDILRHRQMFYDWRLQTICPDYVFKRLQDKDEIDTRVLKFLQWSVKTDASTYRIGEPIGFDVALKNVSDENDASIRREALPRWFTLHSIMLKRVSGDSIHDVYLTKIGYNTYLDYVLWPVLTRDSARYGEYLLKLGEEGSMIHDISPLNRYYNLSEPGEYELTFYTRNFLGGDDEQIGEFPKPCTIRFKIEGNTNWLDSQVVWPEEE